MNELGQKRLIANSAWEMINWAMLCKHDRAENATMMFEKRQNMVLFSILLGDFLSQLTAFKGQSIPLGLKTRRRTPGHNGQTNRPGLTPNGRRDTGMGRSYGGSSRAKGSAAAFALSQSGPHAVEKRKGSMTAS